MSEYEAVLQQLGDFGPYQVRIFILVSLFETPLAWAMLVPIVTAANPGTFCSLFDHIGNSSSGLKVSLNNDSDVDICTVNQSLCGEIKFDPSFTSIVSEVRKLCTSIDILCVHKY